MNTPTPRRRLRTLLFSGLIATTMLTGGALLPEQWSLLGSPQAHATIAAQTPGSFADLVERVTPAVVTITTTLGSDDQENAQRPKLPPGMEEFLRRFGMPTPDQGAPQQRDGEAKALGSGFIIDPAGYVVTNNHVVENARSIMVSLSDGTDLKAELIGTDPKTDLALLKVKSEHKLPYLEFGDSNVVRVGDWAIAIGNPFGLGGTVTAGIVSARGRNIHSGPYDDYLQIDASINRGNSGGPTFDVDGQVVGVNTAIYSPSGGSVGIGFAIPANIAKQVVAQLREKGRVDRGWLGVQIQDVTPEIAGAVGLNGAPKGALIVDVTADSPADKGGLKSGDVITQFNDADIATLRDLTRAVADTSAGSKADVALWRDGKQVHETVTIGEAQQEEKVAALSQKGGPALGLTVAPLTPDTRSRMRLPADARGVVVTDTEANAPEGIRPGDLIVAVGRAPVNSPSELRARLDEARQSGAKSALLLIARDGGQRFVPVDLSVS
jgi:serine protease Do